MDPAAHRICSGSTGRRAATEVDEPVCRLYEGDQLRRSLIVHDPNAVARRTRAQNLPEDIARLTDGSQEPASPQNPRDLTGRVAPLLFAAGPVAAVARVEAVPQMTEEQAAVLCIIAYAGAATRRRIEELRGEDSEAMSSGEHRVPRKQQAGWRSRCAQPVPANCKGARSTRAPDARVAPAVAG